MMTMQDYISAGDQAVGAKEYEHAIVNYQRAYLSMIDDVNGCNDALESAYIDNRMGYAYYKAGKPNAAIDILCRSITNLCRSSDHIYEGSMDSMRRQILVNLYKSIAEWGKQTKVRIN